MSWSSLALPSCAAVFCCIIPRSSMSCARLKCIFFFFVLAGEEALIGLEVETVLITEVGRDLHLRIHRDLVDHIQGAHAEILGTRRELQALIRVFNPSLAQELGLQLEPEINEEVSIPDFIRQQLERNFDLHPDRKLNEDGCYPPLCDIANAFVNSFELSTRLFEPESGIKEPPADQYLALLTSQFLMAKMLDSPEFQDPPRLSHWPSYVSSLQKVPSFKLLTFTSFARSDSARALRTYLKNAIVLTGLWRLPLSRAFAVVYLRWLSG